jgi:hypothetical protein
MIIKAINKAKGQSASSSRAEHLYDLL